MHTPEPRRPRNSAGGAESVTPQVESSSVTPTPRAGYLRRGEAPPTANLHDAIAAGPSVLFDDETGTAVALDVSPQPSQLTQQVQHGGQSRLPRQRPRFHTVQDLDVALHQAIEGKINSRNAWASKEASDLLEGITHTIETTLDAASADDYSGFAKAATVVEGCSKVWTSRVDSTYQQSNQMVQRLLRKDESSGKGPGGEAGDGEDGEGGEDGDEDAPQSQRTKSRSRSAAAAAAAAAATRTLALDATEINLDSKSRTALTQTGVNAQFRAITSKFDQGNAQGLLMNNAPIGRAGNIILDVDYSLMPDSVMAAGRVSGGRRRASARASGATDNADTHTDATDGDATTEEDPKTVASRTSQHAAVEHDAAVYESVVDFPPYAGVTLSAVAQSSASSGAPSPPASARASLAFPQRSGSQASQLDPLLLLPHTSPYSSQPTGDVDEGGRLPASSVKAEESRFSEGGASLSGRLAADGMASAAQTKDDTDGGGDGGYDDYADWADGGGAEDNDNDDDNDTYTADGNAAADLGGVRDLGLEARRLVSGVAEMEAMDTLFHGHTQLALEAEDPTSWCPLSEVAKNPLTGGLGRSELSRLHREHRFTQASKPVGLAEAGGAAGTGSLLKPDGLTAPAAKRGRKERTVVFQLPVGAGGTAGTGTSATTFSTKAVDVHGDSALRQATTAARNITPLGKQLLLAKDAAHAVVAYTQSTVQRTKAEQAGLLLPEAPLPGKTIPSYMPYPVHTQDYFQPFSTTLTQWNLLRKSATGRLIDSGASGNDGATASTLNGAGGGTNAGSAGHRLGHYGGEMSAGGVVEDEEGNGLSASGYGGHAAADMPVEFFPGGAEVEGEDGAEAGGDYADYADLYGPDDDDGGSDDERRYVREGFRGSADARLLAQVELAGTAAVAASDRSSSGSAARSSGGGSGGGVLSDPMALLQVLSSPEATMPNQVDVVRLRQLMWEALQGHLSANQQDKASDLAALRSEARGAATSASDAQHNAPMTAKTAVKAHAQAALDRLRKRARAAESDKSEEEEEEEEKEEKEQPSKRKAGEGSSMASSNALVPAAASKAGPAHVALTRFSDVVRSVLPHIPSVSSTNTLSPAFFFFSILFLANEHNVVLQNVETLDDLRACGIAKGVGE